MKATVFCKLAILLLAGALLASLLIACSEPTPNEGDGTTTTAVPLPPEEDESVTEKNEEDHIHAFGEWVITQAATCSEEGARERTCSCGEVEYGTVEITHTPDADAVCTLCGANLAEGLDFTTNEDGTAYLVYNVSNGSSYVAIPSTYDGLPVVGILADAFYNTNGIQTVHLPASVTSIEAMAFHHNHDLMNLTVAEGNPVYHASNDCIIETATKTVVVGCHDSTLPADGSVTAIGDFAFLGANNQQDFVIPASVTTIGKGAFGDRFFYDNSLTVDPENTVYHSVNNMIVETATKTLVAGFKDFHDIPTDGSVTAIGDYAFYYCHELGQIAVPDCVTSIGDFAFASCWHLADIDLPDSIESIGKYAFTDCRALTEFTFPAGVTAISDGTFEMCTNLTNITIGSNVKSIGANAFYQNAISSIVLPEELVSLGDYAFVYCHRLTEIHLPNSLETIGKYAFMQCISLWRVTTGENITAIGSCAFQDCDQLTLFTLGGTTPAVEPGAFSDCYKLAEVINHSELSIEAGSNEHGGIALRAICVHEDEQSRMINQDGYLFLNNQLVGYRGEGVDLTLPAALIEELENGQILEHAYSIASYAFYNKELNSVVIPERVTEIGAHAFESTYLQSATFENPDGWHTLEYEGGLGTPVHLPDGALHDAATAATYLTVDRVNEALYH